MRKGETSHEMYYTLAFLLIGALIIGGVFVPKIQRMRNMLLEKNECLNPLNMVVNEISEQCKHADIEKEQRLVMPLDLSEECILEVVEDRLCVSRHGSTLECKQPEHCYDFSSGNFLMKGLPYLSRVEIVVNKVDGNNIVTLTDMSR
ncbi:MAG: hypothetical protein KJ709_05595 [Nanoarchaeota archaeon]|nr:hypothetical protein [Nanoarchaeota archaeon]